MSATEISTIRRDEALVLLPDAAHQSEDGRHWIVPLHAWVYEPQQSFFRRKLFVELLEAKHDLHVTTDNARFFDPRVNLLLADNKPGRTIVVDIAGTRATLPPTGDNGHSRVEVQLPVDAAAPDGAILKIRAVLPSSDPRTIETRTRLVGPTGLSVISDIDDTVKITNVIERRRLLESTFYKPFEAVAGMADAYGRLSAAGAPVHYVSSSPWHLAQPLLEFFSAERLPLSALTLKHIRLTDETLLNIFLPGRETKPPAIEAILADYPDREFVLIGDSGEDDAEVYAEAHDRHPEQIARIYIRKVSGDARGIERAAKALSGIEATRWKLFDDPRQIEAP
jgi:phosphatidate phosphatase APP1